MIHDRSAVLGIVAGLGLALGAPAFAQQQMIGEIVATIDGTPYEWRTYGPDRSGTDYNTSLNTGFGMQDVSVMGFPPGDVSMRGILQITFMLMPGSLETFEQDVIFAPEGMSRMWMPPEGESLISIDEFDATAPTGAVSGRVSGRVCRKESMLADPDPDTCKTIEGTFTTQLPHTTF